MTSAADVVRTHLAAFSAHDLDAMLATLAPDAEFVTGTDRIDPAEFAEFFGGAMRELDPSMTLGTMIEQGRHVACEFVESVTFDGVRHTLNRAAFYVVDGGVITSAKVYDERD